MSLDGTPAASLTGAPGLLACVHCGFCLQACPTYLELGDENDSPRGRLHLMRAVGEGRLSVSSQAFHTHIDRCLGCRACEPVCPSGVPYGQLLELAREDVARARIDRSGLSSLLLWVYESRTRSRWFHALSRLARATPVLDWLLRALPSGTAWARARLGMGMLLATRPLGGSSPSAPADYNERNREVGPSVSLLEGCVQAGLFGHVNGATRRVLAANGFYVAPAPEQACCGALHAHAGDLERAKAMARNNIAAFEASQAGVVVVNAAGCGAAMKDYGHLLAADEKWAERASAFSQSVRDVSEVLAQLGPRRGAPLPKRVVYDAPCHLVHAQGVSSQPLALLDAVPELVLTRIEGETECCGGAGIYGITHPDLGGRITNKKLRQIEASDPDIVATGNPGCIMQIGGSLLAEGWDGQALHPIQLLDESYRRAGFYDEGTEEEMST